MREFLNGRVDEQQGWNGGLDLQANLRSELRR